jgi:hypothetical protein
MRMPLTGAVYLTPPEVELRFFTVSWLIKCAFSAGAISCFSIDPVLSLSLLLVVLCGPPRIASHVFSISRESSRALHCCQISVSVFSASRFHLKSCMPFGIKLLSLRKISGVMHTAFVFKSAKFHTDFTYAKMESRNGSTDRM